MRYYKQKKKSVNVKRDMFDVLEPVSLHFTFHVLRGEIDQQIVQCAFRHMMHVGIIAPILNISVGTNGFQNDGFLRNAKRDNQQNLVPGRDLHCITQFLLSN